MNEEQMTLGSKEQNFIMVTNWKMQKDILLRSILKYLMPETKAIQPRNKTVPVGRSGGRGGYICEALILLL